MKKRLMALLLSGVMAASFLTACGNTESSSDTAEEDASEEDADSSEEEEGFDEIIEINMMILDEAGVAEKKDDVEAAINEITEAEIGVHVNMMFIDFGSYANQVTLAVSGDEQIDLMVTTPMSTSSFDTLQSQNGLTDITEYIEGTEVEELLGDFLSATTIDGAIYGVPTYRLLATSQYIIMRKDVLEDLGLLEYAENMTTWEEYEVIMQAVLDSDWDLAPLSATTDKAGHNLDANNFADVQSYEGLGDYMALIAVNMDDDTNTVYNFYESEVYQTEVELLREWYEAGYIYKDTAVTQDTGDEMIKNNVIFSYIYEGEIGIEETRKSATGYDCVCVKITDLPLSTGTCTKFVWTVPSCAKEVEAATEMLKLMYTNSDIANLLAWGIEGVDYVINEDGNAVYPDGIDESNVNYHTSDYLYGNQFLVLPWGEDTEEGWREIQLQAMEEAIISPYLGFTCDTTTVSNETAACNTVIDEYLAVLESGTVDNSIYEEFIAALENAGASTVVEEYQTQLNAWLEENG